MQMSGGRALIMLLRHCSLSESRLSSMSVRMYGLALRILHLADVEAAHHVVVIRQESVLVALVEFALIGLHLRLDVLEDAKDASSVRRIKPKVVFCVRRQRLPAEHRIIFVGQV